MQLILMISMMILNQRMMTIDRFSFTGIRRIPVFFFQVIYIKSKCALELFQEKGFDLKKGRGKGNERT